VADKSGAREDGIAVPIASGTGQTSFVPDVVDQGTAGTAGDRIAVATDASGICSLPHKLQPSPVTGGNLVVHS